MRQPTGQVFHRHTLELSPNHRKPQNRQGTLSLMFLLGLERNQEQGGRLIKKMQEETKRKKKDRHKKNPTSELTRRQVEVEKTERNSEKVKEYFSEMNEDKDSDR